MVGRIAWAGDGDAHLYAARIGLTRFVGAPPPRHRMRRRRLLQILRASIQRDLMLEGAAAALAYIFGLRIPSELLR